MIMMFARGDERRIVCGGTYDRGERRGVCDERKGGFDDVVQG